MPLSIEQPTERNGALGLEPGIWLIHENERLSIGLVRNAVVLGYGTV
jgi:hypothetical protein